jgi:hypothetical protein
MACERGGEDGRLAYLLLVVRGEVDEALGAVGVEGQGTLKQRRSLYGQRERMDVSSVFRGSKSGGWNAEDL